MALRSGKAGRGALLALAAFAAWAARVDPVAACDVASPPSVTRGVVGLESHVAIEPSVELPRNVAFAYWAGYDRPQLFEDGAPVELELLGPEATNGHAGLLSAAQPLEPGRSYIFDGLELRVGDFVDAAAPSAPEVRQAELEVTEYDEGCGSSSCGERMVVASAQLQGAADDRTPSEHLTYAIYFGSTAEAARTASEPERFSLLENGRAWFFADDAWADRDVYLSVATLDFAGNQSERTEPIRIHTAPAGCEIAHARVGELAWIAAALLACAVRARRLA
jgi:hypothetical protein